MGERSGGRAVQAEGAAYAEALRLAVGGGMAYSRKTSRGSLRALSQHALHQGPAIYNKGESIPERRHIPASIVVCSGRIGG